MNAVRARDAPPADPPPSWLTVGLRPAGELAGRDAARLARAVVLAPGPPGR